MTASTSAPARPARNLRWRVVDIVTAAVVGVAAGVLFWAWGLAWGPLSAALAFTPGLSGLLAGGWLFAGVLGALIIRKPGAALFTELVAALLSTLIGNQWGPLTLVSGLVQGLGAELIFLVFLYANWRLYVAVLAGAATGLTCAINDLILWYPGAGAEFAVIYTIASTVSGAVIAGLVSWLLVKAIAATGALNRFASGREARADV